MQVRHADITTTYQLEIKNWSAHAIAGAKLALNASEEQVKAHKLKTWLVEWDEELRTLKRQTAKVLTPMKCSWPGPVEPLLCMWAPMHPDGLEHPWFIVDLPPTEHFRTLNVFSMSSYLRTLSDETIELEMPDLTARLKWLDRLFIAVPTSVGQAPDNESPVDDDSDTGPVNPHPEPSSHSWDYLVDNLTGSSAARMAAVPVGKTLAENIELGVYYAPESRSFQPHAYLGLYNHQSIVAIGKIDKIVSAALIDGELETYSDHQDLSIDERERIKQAILQAPKHGFEIHTDRRFWLFKWFTQTEFKKTSPGGMMNRRYFDLSKELELTEQEALPDVDAIANLLRRRTWK